MDIQSIVVQVVMIIATTVLLPMLTKAFNVFIEQTREKIEGNRFNNSLNKLLDLVETSYFNIKENFVKDLKDITKDGNWNKEKAKEARDKCLQNVLNQLKNSDKEILKAGFEDLESYVFDKIEELVSKDKDKFFRSEAPKPEV